MQSLISKGIIITNEKCVDEEFRLRNDRLEKSYPKKFMAKFIERFSDEGKQAIAEREKAERELSSKKSLYTFVDINYYHECGQKITELLLNETCLSAYDIAERNELTFLTDLQEKDSGCDRRWREYFVIFNMQPFVANGIIDDRSFSDAILDTHQYSNVHGKSILRHTKEKYAALYDDPDLDNS